MGLMIFSVVLAVVNDAEDLRPDDEMHPDRRTLARVTGV